MNYCAIKFNTYLDALLGWHRALFPDGFSRLYRIQAGSIRDDSQVTMLNALLTDFYGKLTTEKWAVMSKSSTDTALRDINDLIKKGLMQKSEASGRSTSYELLFNSSFA